MKKNILLLTAFIITTIGYAQVDRTQPKLGTAPVINLGKPKTFTLPNGLKVMVVEDNKLPKVSMNLSIDNSPYAEGIKKGVSDLTGALIGEGTTKTPKDKFNEEVDFLGASLNFSSNGAFASTLSKNFNRILEMMAEGILSPNFTQSELDKQRDQIVEGLKTQDKSAEAIADRVSSVLTFGKNHPSGEYLTEKSLKSITLIDLKNNYKNYFSPGNAYLIVIGDVKFEEVKTKVTNLFGTWAKGTAPLLKYPDPKPAQYTQINLIDVPSANQAELTFINPVRLSMNDKDYFAALIANNILGGGSEGYLFKTLREKKGWTYGAYSSIRGSKEIGSFTAGGSLKMATIDSAVIVLNQLIKDIRTKEVSDEDFNNAKMTYIGNFVRGFAKPETVSRYALNIETQKLPADFYENYLKNINAVTKADVMRVAKKYFMLDNARIIVAANAKEAGPLLEKTKIPVLYFDKWGVKTTKPEVKKVDASVTAQSVLNNYIKAIGGEAAVKNVKTISMTASGKHAQIPAELSLKNKMSSGKKIEDIGMGGNSMMKFLIDGSTANFVGQGKKMPFDGEYSKTLLSAAHPFLETEMLKNNATLKGVEKFNDKDVYAIQMGTLICYYDLTTGLKLGDSIKLNLMGQDMNFNTTYSDYKDYSGIKQPSKLGKELGPGMLVTFDVTDIKVNEGVTDEDFK
jgi:zinc protease